MRASDFLVGLGSAVLIGSAALAQSAAPAQGQGQSAGAAASQAPASAGSSFSDKQLSAFASVAVELQRMQAEGGASDPTAMAAAVQKSGLTVEQYNQIAAQMRSDPAFNARVQELAQSSGNEAGPARQSGASTSPAPSGGGVSAPGQAP